MKDLSQTHGLVGPVAKLCGMPRKRLEYWIEKGWVTPWATLVGGQQVISVAAVKRCKPPKPGAKSREPN